MRQALKVDKEKWLEEEMREMEEDIRCRRHGNFFRRITKLTSRGMIPTNTTDAQETGGETHQIAEAICQSAQCSEWSS